MRLRTFSKKNTLDSNEYINKKKNIENIKNSFSKLNERTNEYNSKNYIINFNDKSIEWYDSYETFLNFVKGFYIIKPNCSHPAIAPLTINNALTSQIKYNELFSYIENEFINEYSQEYYKLLSVDICKEKTNILYSYGLYYDNKENKLFNFPININLNECSKNVLTTTFFEHGTPNQNVGSLCGYKYGAYPDGKHKHFFPSQYNFISYLHNHNSQTPTHLFKSTNHILPFSLFPRMNRDKHVLHIGMGDKEFYSIVKEDVNVMD